MPMHLLRTSKGIINLEQVAVIAPLKGKKTKIRVKFSEKSSVQFSGDEADQVLAYILKHTDVVNASQKRRTKSS